MLEDLQEMGFVKEVETGLWLRQDHSTLLTYDELRQMREDEAEVKAGNGSQSVYGWYLLAYRQLADMKGEEVFPMKIGTTISGSFGRAKTHIGTAPEKPVLGFLLRVDQAAKIEGDLQKYLKEKGRHMPEALGKEWFLTNPNELYSLTRDMLMESVAEKKRDLAWSVRTLEELGNAP